MHILCTTEFIQTGSFSPKLSWDSQVYKVKSPASSQRQWQTKHHHEWAAAAVACHVAHSQPLTGQMRPHATCLNSPGHVHVSTRACTLGAPVCPCSWPTTSSPPSLCTGDLSQPTAPRAPKSCRQHLGLSLLGFCHRALVLTGEERDRYRQRKSKKSPPRGDGYTATSSLFLSGFRVCTYTSPA